MNTIYVLVAVLACAGFSQAAVTSTVTVSSATNSDQSVALTIDGSTLTIPYPVLGLASLGYSALTLFTQYPVPYVAVDTSVDVTLNAKDGSLTTSFLGVNLDLPASIVDPIRVYLEMALRLIAKP